MVRTDQVAIGEAGDAVHVGEVVLRFADDAYITPGEARKLAEALVELADYADRLAMTAYLEHCPGTVWGDHEGFAA